MLNLNKVVIIIIIAGIPVVVIQGYIEKGKIESFDLQGIGILIGATAFIVFWNEYNIKHGKGKLVKGTPRAIAWLFEERFIPN